MSDVENARARLAELLRHPEDLDKIPALKSEFTRKKAAIDGQLRHGLKSQLEVTQSGMNSLVEGQRTVAAIKEEMMKIDKLCAEAQNMIQDFPHINLVAQTHRNFELVRQMKRDVDAFPERLENLEYLLGQDDEDPANQPNLLEVHCGLSELRDIRDRAMDQIKSGENAGMELIENLRLDSGATVQDYFTRLDDVIEWFDKHIGEACLNLIELVQSGNDGMVVRLALVIEEEEKKDKKAKALQDAQREYKDLASRFKSIATGPKELRGYKEKFLQAIQYVCQARFEQLNEKFQDDPDKLEKAFKWFFNNLNVVKLGMVALMPKKWKIFRTYCGIYHKEMHDWLIKQIEDEGLRPPQILAIISWVEKYYEKMAKLGVPEDWLSPHVIDNRAPDLVREYRQNIVRAVEEWMGRMSENDKAAFLAHDESALDTDENGVFRTKTLGDSWRILMENLEVAASSERADVVEGVVESMFRVLSSRQRLWQTLISDSYTRYAAPTADLEGLQSLQDWILAIANDQINSIAITDDDDERPSYLDLFERSITPLVSDPYVPTVAAQTASLREGYLELGILCIHTFVSLIFTTDFKTIMPEFFTPAWYAQKRMSAITTTFSDYLADYLSVLHPGLREILLTELSDELLSHYLSAVRNKGAKFRRSDPFTEKIKDDVLTVFQFFETQDPGVYEDIRQKWRAVSELVRLLEADKMNVANVYAEIKGMYPDVGMGWVEAVLRARDDFERSMLNSVKARAVELRGEGAAAEGGAETIFAKVK